MSETPEERLKEWAEKQGSDMYDCSIEYELARDIVWTCTIWRHPCPGHCARGEGPTMSDALDVALKEIGR